MDAGLVISQSPAGGSDAAPGATVQIVVSEGPETILLDDLAGRSARDVAFILGNLAWWAEFEDESSLEVADGFIIRTEPLSARYWSRAIPSRSSNPQDRRSSKSGFLRFERR